ncbi:MAG: ABC transporter substrate-binding protein, partial [Pyrinomonadaceae bacterium]
MRSALNKTGGTGVVPAHKTVRLFALLLLCMALCGLSCRREASVPTPQKRDAQATARPARIISLSPNVTEILYGIGAFDRVVAVSEHSDYPPEAMGLPRVGGWGNPNLEQIAALRPELVIFPDAQAGFVKDKLEAMGIRTLSVPSLTLEDAYTAIDEIGRATGNEAQAQTLLAQTRADVE